MIAETFLELITDWAHWAQEGVAETAFFVVEVIVLDRLLHRIDHKRHRRWKGKAE